MKKVCLFGIYDPGYSRNRVLTQGFTAHGWEVDHCRIDPKTEKGISKYWKLWKLGREQRKNNYDLVIMAYPSQPITWLGRLIFGPNIVFDAFLSMYDSNVFDRKLYGKYSIWALRDYFFDWISVKISRFTLLDTDNHIDYYAKQFHLPKEKFLRVLVGTDGIFEPREKKTNLDKFVVHFHGTYIPLQGIEYIIKAADLVKNKKNIVFNVIGTGQTYKECRALADELKIQNINFINKVPIEVLADYIAESDICLGIFGTTEKTMRVIPNKVFEGAAAGKALITADTPGIREVFTDNKDMVFCKISDEKSLAEKILMLEKDPALRKRIAEGARKTFLETSTPEKIVGKLIRDLMI